MTNVRWLIVVLGLGVVFWGLVLADAMRAQYYKGVADSAAAVALSQAAEIADGEVVVDSLASELREMEEEARVHAAEDSTRLEELRSTQVRSSRLADSLAVELEARLDSTQATQLRELVGAHGVELATVQDMLTIEHEVSARETLRANQAVSLVFQLEAQVIRLEERDLTRLVEIEALREASGGIGFCIDASWVTGAGGVVAGFLLANWLQGAR